MEAGVIELSSSPWAAPTVLVKRKDGSWHFCVNYHHLNCVTCKDSYPLPRINDALDRIAGSSWFNSLDLCSGCWQVEQTSELTFCVTRRELLAVILGICHFRAEQYGRRFLLRTHHASVTLLLNFKEPAGQAPASLA